MDKPEEMTHIEIPDEPVAEELQDEPTSLADLAKSGLQPGEIKMAKDQGIVEPTPAEIAAAAAADKSKEITDGKKKEETQTQTVDERFRVLSEGKSPETIIAEIGAKGELTKEQESVLLASLTRNGQSLYWAQKKERKSRQLAITEAEAKLAAKDQRIAELEAKLKQPAPSPKLDENGDPIVETDDEREIRLAKEAADAVDPRKKPLTLEDLERIEAEKAKKIQDEQEQRSKRADEIKEALNFQQEDAKTRYADFDEATERVADILKAANGGTLEKLYPDAKDRSRILQKCRDLVLAYAKADTFEDGVFNPADMTYELAKEHPEFGAQPKNNASKKGETDADGNPESARRVITNANRRGSSATLNGSGSRRIPLEDLTPEQARRLPTRDWNKLPLATRERLLGR